MYNNELSILKTHTHSIDMNVFFLEKYRRVAKKKYIFYRIINEGTHQ